ncbi:sensor histidine kinase [Phytohabitans kaempferiae]|uniref:histidine kinase n=1 Tax=Phytohabitans kaempferiae TaxID=1620943 RepID=A0ABV6MAD8_9ACTN
MTGNEEGVPTVRLARRGVLPARFGHELAYAIGSGPIVAAGVAFTVLGLLASAVLAVVFVGLPLLAAVVAGARQLGGWEADRGRRLLRLDLGLPAPPPSADGFWPRLRASVSDPAGWRTMLLFVLKLPIAIVAFCLALGGCGVGLVLATYPSWFWLGSPTRYEDGPARSATKMTIGDLYLDTWPEAIAVGALGLFLLLLTPWLVHAVLVPDRLLAKALLRPTRAEERIRVLEEARDYAVDDSAAALRRIERDLHDGAQARLVTLAMDLGLAKETLDGTGGESEVRQARELIDIAHENAKKALIELRNLARGIYPPVLDEGLGAALASLGDACSLPVNVYVDVPFRPSPAVETIAYFCTAELLTNVAKHSRAQHATIRATQRFDMLRLEVGDDGVGGASFGGGTGLSGLADRLRTVDGRIALNSPRGGPTLVTVHLPLRA